MNEIVSWNYDNSVNKMKGLVYNWKNLTVEMVKELYAARENLDGRDGRNLPLNVADATFRKTWNSYCQEIDIDRSTAHRWLERYIPEENKLLTHEEFRKVKCQKKEEQIREDFRNYDTKALKKRVEEAVAPKREKMQEQKERSEKIDTFFDNATEYLQEIEDKKEKLGLNSREENINQEVMFSTIEDYIYSENNVSRQIEKASNLIKQLRLLIVKLQQKTLDK